MLNKEEIQLIQIETSLKVLDGKKVLIFFLPLLLNDIYKRLGEDLKRKEVLIISDEEELTKELIESLHKEIRFVTLVGDDENTIENISKHVLEKTGLSLFYSKNIQKILKNYSIIINLKENSYIDINRVRKEALIFDFSINKGFQKAIKSSRTSLVIEDFIFQIDSTSNWIKKLASSYIYEWFYEFKYRDLKGLLVNEKIYNIEEFIDYEVKNKGKL